MKFINTKKSRLMVCFLSFILIMSVFACTIPVVQAKTHNPFKGINATDFDATDLKTAEGKSKFESDKGFIGSALATDAVVYKNVNFSENPLRGYLYAGVPERYAGTVQIRIDSYNGPVLCDFKIKGSSWDSRTQHVAPVQMDITGTHDLYLVWTVGVCHIFSFSFVSGENVKNEYNIYNGKSIFEDLQSSENRFYCELMAQMGFVNSASKKVFDENFPVTRGEFAISVNKALNMEATTQSRQYFLDVDNKNKCYNAVQNLKGVGYIDGYDGVYYKPNEFITINDAVTLCAKSLGYGSVIDSEYMKKSLTAKKNELLSSIKYDSPDDILTRTQLSRLFYKFITCEYIEPSEYTNSNVKYEKYNNILEKTKRIYQKTGIVDGNFLTSLDDPTKQTKKDTISIDNILYNIKSPNIDGYLGRKCTFFYEENDFGKNIVAISEDKKTIQSVIYSHDKPRINNYHLYYNVNDREKSVVLSQKTKIIYNGKPYENADIDLILDMQNYHYENGILKPNNGEKREFLGDISAVSYDGKSIVDILYINSRQNIVYGGYDLYNHTLSDTLSDKNFYINDEDANSYGNIFLDNKISEFSQLPKNCVGSIYESINNKGIKLKRVYFFTNSFDGTIMEIRKDEVTVGEEVFKVAPEYKRAIENKLPIEKFEVGQIGTVYLNDSKEIIRFVSKGSEMERFGVFVNFKQESSLDETISIKLNEFDKGNAIYVCKDNIIFDGVRRTDLISLVNGIDGYEDSGIKSITKGTLIRFSVDENNELVMIDTPKSIACDAYDKLKLISSDTNGESLIFKTNPSIFGATSQGNKYAVRDKAIILQQPQVGSGMFEDGVGFLKDDLRAKLGSTDKWHTVVLYSLQQNSKLADVVVKYVGTNDYSSDVVVYEGKGTILDHNKENSESIKVNSYGDAQTYVISKNVSGSINFSDLKEGTLLRLCFDPFGEVNGRELVYNPFGEDGVINGNSSENTANIQSELRYCKAKIKGREDNYVELEIANNGKTKTEFINTIGVTMMICENKNDEFWVKKANTDTLNVDDTVVAVLSYGVVKSIYIYK